MSDIDDLLGQLPIDQIAAELGVSPDQARTAAAQALPALMHGMAANAADPAGAASLNEAVGQHAPLSGSVDLGQVDVADGEKIVGHVFGSNADAVAAQLAGTQQAAGLSSGLTSKLLAMLAPIVLSYIAGKIGGGGGQASGTSAGGGLLEEILKGAVSGAGGSSGGAGSIIGDVLGGLLGGGKR